MPVFRPPGPLRLPGVWGAGGLLVIAGSALRAESLAKAAVIAGSAHGFALLERAGVRGAILLTERGEALAKQLVEMVRAAVVTGDSSRTALNKCLQAIKDRALDLLDTPASDQKAIDVEPD